GAGALAAGQWPVGVVVIPQRHGVVGIAQEQAGGVDLLLAVDAKAEAQVAGEVHLPVGAGALAHILLRVGEFPLGGDGGVEHILVGQAGQEAELHAIVEIEPIAEVHLAVDVLAGIIAVGADIPLQGLGQLAVDQLCVGAGVAAILALEKGEDIVGADITLVAVQGALDHPRQGAGAVVGAAAVTATAIGAQAAAAGLGVVAGADLDIEDEFLGN